MSDFRSLSRGIWGDLKPSNRSLLWRFIVGQFFILAVFCTTVSVNFLWQVKGAENSEIEKILVINSQVLANTLRIHAKTPEQARQIISWFDTSANDTLAFFLNTHITVSGPAAGTFVVLRVLDKGHNEIYRSKAFPPNFKDASKPLAVIESNQGHAWYVHHFQAPDKEWSIQIAQTKSSVDVDTWISIKRYLIYPLLWFVPLLAILTFFVILKGLQPLRQLTRVIAKRQPNDLYPLTNVISYIETQPLINEINSLLLKLDITLQRERNFLADAAHELRTPLAVIQTQLHVLTTATSDADKNAAADELNSGVERAASLVQKLLLTAKVSDDNFKPRFERIDLTAFVQERVAALAMLAARKNIDIELEAPRGYGVLVDCETFISAVDNVLDNAIRYTSHGGQISISISSLRAGNVCLRVVDSGVGIPPELYARVLERFFRVAGTGQQGSGLGLAIVKRVLLLHGGDVRFSPGLNQRGLSVDLTLPCYLE